ncbi:hydantoinase B/oxoprolinase family protein [Acidimangrovimonas sediminis]|uniref:hydantoinase B/oxoprolinase family protein n=1 Tax=Acidimangrovimonas sediminis TaxID=2056283 RepID=UPI001304D989|nr:hydantoinase B/oxoprolinase family protein [Acidimangrovimonas sediminis]
MSATEGPQGDSTGERAALSPIRLQLLQNALTSITDEMFSALTRTAFSGNIKERRDHSTAIIDIEGNLVAQASQSLPIHLSGLIGLVGAIRAAHPLETIRPGDMFIANDPHEGGGSHLPDINTAEPVFIGGTLVCFVCTIAHHSDIGGARAGSMASGLTEIWQEGIRIPLIKLYSAGRRIDDIWNMILLNMRMREERLGDFNAQFAASRLGLRRMEELSARVDAPTLRAAFAGILDATERRMRSAIAAIPDGTYSFEDVMDGDGLEVFDIPIRVTMTVAGDAIAMDFAGTGAQVPGNINLVFNGLQSTVSFALKVLLDPRAPNNSGLLRPVTITAPEGSVVNAVAPAAVAHRVQTGMRVVDVIFGALAAVLPRAVTAASNGSNTSAMFYGRNPRTGREYVYFETLGGGSGARLGRDGKDGVQAGLTNTSNLPVEAIEAEYPLLVEGYNLIEGSGGAGRTRGGRGIARAIRPLGHVTEFSGSGERFRVAPWGLEGGAPGRTGQFSLRRDGAEAPEALPEKASRVTIGPDAVLVIETPGGGGWGDPAGRKIGDA